MKSNLITGNKGFVGSNLVEYFENRNKKIIGISRNPLHNEISYEDLDEEIINKSNCFIHLAGKAHDLKKISNHVEYYDINTELTKKLFDKFLKSTCEVFIFMSSIKAVTDYSENPITENVNANPITIYGKSKLAAENYILAKEIPKWKRVYILRPCIIHGPHNKGNLNLLYSFVSKGFPYPFGKYENKRSFLSVENLCFVINELIDNPSIESGVYNISDDVSISTNDLVKLISKELKKPTRILNTPKFILKILAKIGDLISAPLNSERLQKLTENFEVSNLKIKKAIHKELPLSSKDGIKKTISFFQNMK